MMDVKKMKQITAHEVARRRADKSLAALCKETGFDPSYASRIEAGEIPASERYRRGFSRACGVAANEIFHPDTHRVLVVGELSSTSAKAPVG